MNNASGDNWEIIYSLGGEYMDLIWHMQKSRVVKALSVGLRRRRVLQQTDVLRAVVLWLQSVFHVLHAGAEERNFDSCPHPLQIRLQISVLVGPARGEEKWTCWGLRKKFTKFSI
jgi:hypothetical protein